MTAELWMLKPCPTHQDDDECLQTEPLSCAGPSRVRLDPERVVFQATWETRDLTVQDVLDALEADQ